MDTVCISSGSEAEDGHDFLSGYVEQNSDHDSDSVHVVENAPAAEAVPALEVETLVAAVQVPPQSEKFNPPKRRSKREHQLIMARAREMRCMKRRRQERDVFVDAASQVVGAARRVKRLRGTKAASMRRHVALMKRWAPPKGRTKSERAKSDVQVAGDISTIRVEDLAKLHGISAKAARRAQLACCATLLKKQVSIVQAWTAPVRRGLCCAVHMFLGFDGAKVRAQMPTRGGEAADLGPTNPAMLWPVLVSAAHILLVFENEASDVLLPLSLVVAACTETSAEACHSALFTQGPNANILSLIRKMQSEAAITTTTWGMDGHYGNERLFAAHAQGKVVGGVNAGLHAKPLDHPINVFFVREPSHAQGRRSGPNASVQRCA